MKNKSHLTAFLFILTIIIFAASCGGGGGGGGSVVSFGNNSKPHNGGDAGGWGNGGYTGNGFGGNGGGLGSSGDSNIVITGSTPLEVGTYNYNGASYDSVEALYAALAANTLEDVFYVDFQVEGESTPRKARVTANGKSNDGNDILIEHQYKAFFPDENGGTQEVLFYKRDGIELPGGSGTVNIGGFDFESGWKIDGTFYSHGAKLSVASNGDVDFMSRAVQETSVFGFKSDSTGGYIMGFRNDALQENGNSLVVSSNKQISSIELPSKPVDLNLSQAPGFTNVNFQGNIDRLAGITLPNTVTTIADNAFQDCTSLSSVNLPSSVTTIGDYAFDGCNSLSSIELPASVQTIGQYAFSGCDALQTVTFASGPHLQEIGEKAFWDCSSLHTIELPSTVATIGYCAFGFCSSLESFTIPDGVTELFGTFYNCGNLESITIPSSVSILKDMTFMGVKNGCELIFDSTAGSMGYVHTGDSSDAAFPQTSYKVKFTGTSIPTTDSGDSIFNSNLSEVTLANTVASIPQNAFKNCSGLTTVTIENTPAASSLASIGGSAFYNCTSLQTINIPASLAAIGGSAFYNCTNLQKINIPASVGAIGPQAFFQAGDGNLEITFEDSQTMTQCSLPNQNYKVVLNRGVPKIGGGVLGDNGPSIFENDMNLKEVVYAGGPNLMAYAFTGCSSLTTVTFQSYPTAIQTTPLPDNVHNIIFAPKNEMFIHDVSRLFNISSISSGSVSVTFQFKNSADVGSVPPVINIRSDAFLSFGTSTSYQFDSEPDYYIYYESSSCFPAGSTGTRGGTNYTWTLSGSTYRWQQ